MFKVSGDGVVRVLFFCFCLFGSAVGCGYRKLGNDGSTNSAADGAMMEDRAPVSDRAPSEDRAPSQDMAGAEAGLGAASLSIDSLAHDFGTVVAQTASADAVFTVRNAGAAATGVLLATLSGGSTSGFSIKTDHCSTTSLAGGASCQIVAIVTPTGADLPSADLIVSASPGGSVTAHLTATAIAAGALKINPPAQDFGMVAQNRGSASQTFTISNSGQQSSGSVTVLLSGTDQADFQITADGCGMQSLVANGSCQITVRFSPTGVGAKSSSLTVSGNPGGSAAAQLSGTGITQGTVSITPDSHDFGTIQQLMLGGSQVYTVKNTGQATTSPLTAVLGGTDKGDFTIAANSCDAQTLPAGATCTVTVQFSPVSAGSKLVSLSVVGAAGENGASQLTGTSLASPSIAIAPVNKQFASVTVNQGASATFLISNPGGVATGIPSVTLAGAAAADSGQFSIPTGSNGCVAAIPPLGSCMVTVRFAPTATGVKNATLTVSASPGTSTTATITGTGVAAGKLSVSPLNQDFGSLLQGVKSTTQVTFTVTNSGASPTGTLQASIAGSTEFQIMGDTCSQTALTALATCTVTMVFAPTSASPSGTLQIAATNPADSTSAGLTGVGLMPAKLVVAPTSASFADTQVNQTSAPVSFTVRNTGGVSSGTPLAATISGTNMGDFGLVTGMSTCAGALPAGTTCNLVVAFTPKTSGNSKTASLNVSATPGGAAAASLTGNGVTPALLTFAPAANNLAAFGNVVVGVPKDQTFVVSNTGQLPSSGLLIGFNNAGGAGFSLLAGATTDCAANTAVPGNSNCNLRVHFAPAGRGMQSASLSVSAASGGAPAALALTGTGQLPAGLSANPASVNLANVQTGVSASTSVIITNGGDVATGTPTLTNSNAAELTVVNNGCSAAIGAGATCTISLSFKPAALGIRSGSITVAASGSSAVFTVSATGTVACGAAAQACCGGAGGTCTAPGTVCGIAAICVAPAGNGGTCQSGLQCLSNNCTGSTCCATGQTSCGGTCVDLAHDNANCGTCGTACTASKNTCVASACRGNDGQPCATGGQCASGTCTLFFVDGDGDNYGTSVQAGFCTITTAPAGYATVSGDCCDSNPAVNPGITAFQMTPADLCPAGTMVSPLDYNCSGVLEKQYPLLVSCGPPPDCVPTYVPFADSVCGTVNAVFLKCFLMDFGAGPVCEQNGTTANGLPCK